MDTIGHVKILCGISGSGKTTYADKLVKEGGYTKLSIDEYMWREHGESGIDYPMSEYRTRYAMSEISLREELIRLAMTGHDVVLDMTFCHRDKRDEYRRIMSGHGITYELVYFPVDFPTAWERINSRNSGPTGPNKAHVTKEMLQQFYLGFEHPGPDEPFTTPGKN